MYEKIIDKYLKQSYKYQSGGYNRKLPITLSDGRKIELSTNSDEYRKLYESGKLTNKVGDKEYVGTRLENVEITAPKDPNYVPYTRQQFIKERVGNLGNITDPNNMPADMEKQYQAELNDRAAKKVLDRLPQPNGNKASQFNNLRWYNSLTDAEKQVVRSSKYANQFLPAERAYNLDQSNKAQSKGFINSLRPDNLALATKGTPERFRIFPNAKNKIEDNISPLVIFGDMVEGVGTVPKNIKDGNYVEAALGIGMPLLGGALASKAKGLSFVNDVLNPFAGLDNIVKKRPVLGNKTSVNEEANNMLSEFKSRINTEEGQQRAKALGANTKKLDALTFDPNSSKVFADGEINAYYSQRGNMIGISNDMPIKQTKSSVRHELEHATQNSTPSAGQILAEHLDEKRGLNEYQAKIDNDPKNIEIKKQIYDLGQTFREKSQEKQAIQIERNNIDSKIKEIEE